MQTFDRVAIKAEAKRVFYANRGPCVTMAFLVVAAMLVLTTVSLGFLSALMNGVILVTAAGFFLNYWRETPVTVSAAISDTFDNGFLRKMGGMLWMDLKVFLWSLLLVVPGILKALSYALTPFILYDCPNVPAMEACRISEKIMQGHRGEFFIARLSFLGWGLLGAATFGILDVLFVEPYSQLTFSGIYEELKQIALDNGVVTQAELDGQITY